MPSARSLSAKQAFRIVAINFAISTSVSLAGVGRPAPWWLTATIFGGFISIGVLGMVWAIPRVRVSSFFATVLFQVVAILGFMGGAFVIALLASMAFAAKASPFSGEFWSLASQVFSSSFIHLSLAIFIVVTFAVSLVLQVSRKLGPGVLLNWVTGKYHEPREEERVFMFLDLRDSTTHAERLGAREFSTLIRDCFRDLASPCELTGAEVSHYIGDEAVISWKPARGLANANCLRLFALFQDSILARERYYLGRFGFLPAFKAGAHIGPVVATEVGEAKSEIVFHGDVMNTTARIQGLCNDEGAEFLISKDLLDRLGSQADGLSFRSLGLKPLKGRIGAVEVIAVERTD